MSIYDVQTEADKTCEKINKKKKKRKLIENDLIPAAKKTLDPLSKAIKDTSEVKGFYDKGYVSDGESAYKKIPKDIENVNSELTNIQSSITKTIEQMDAKVKKLKQDIENLKNERETLKSKFITACEQDDVSEATFYWDGSEYYTYKKPEPPPPDKNEGGDNSTK